MYKRLYFGGDLYGLFFKFKNKKQNYHIFFSDCYSIFSRYEK